MDTPTSDMIRAARAAAGDTQTQAIQRLHRDRRMTWDDWEAGRRVMEPALWELYLLRTGQHPTHRLVAIE
jgi:hypothetical protein